MSTSTAILITLVGYKALLIGIGFWASKRNRDGVDFYLGGRQLGPWVAALSSSASASSAWTMLGLSGMAFSVGMTAFWLAPACIGGFIINWTLVARRLRERSGADGTVTLTGFLSEGAPARYRRLITVSASLIILVSLGIYVASQFQGAGKTFHDSMGIESNMAIVVGAGVIFLYTVTGGFWAVSISDVIQGLLMVIAAIIVPGAALIAVGGPGALIDGLAAQDPRFLNMTAGKDGIAGVVFVISMLAIGLGATGQPHVVNRFMALRSPKDVRTGAIVSISWATIVFFGMFLAGLCGRVLFQSLGDGEVVLIRLTTELFPPVMAGVFVAAILSAIMSTADSQLLVCGSTIAHDLPRSRRDRILLDRFAVFAVTVLAAIAAMTVARSVFNSALFAWSALGAAFGPLLLVRLFRGPVKGPYVVAAIWVGFTTTLVWYFIPVLKGAAKEILPGFLAALLVAWLGSRGPVPAADADPVVEA
jgi:sodium/proline symporter